MVNFNLNQKACNDRPNLTPITVSSNTYQFILVYCTMFPPIHFEIQELWVIIITNTRTQPENFQEM